MSSYSRQQLEDWLKTIEVKGSVLDVGGSQNPIITRVIYDSCEFTILDLEKPHECKVEPGLIGDIQDKQLPELYSDYKNEYDVAFCIEVSEYWYDPLQALKNISMFLKEGGVLYASFHFVYPVHNPEDQDYLRYTPWGVSRLLAEAGFEIEEMRNREFMHPNIVTILYDGEGMRGINDTHNIQGCLVKAKKI